MKANEPSETTDLQSAFPDLNLTTLLAKTAKLTHNQHVCRQLCRPQFN